MRPNSRPLEEAVRTWWDHNVCGTDFVGEDEFSSEYFAEIERIRHRLEPFIPDFAGFGDFAGRKVLEVGVGAGTDFAAWVRGGAIASGVDLSAEAIEHTRRRLELEGLRPSYLQQGSAEDLALPDDHFDLVYSWGVIHHSPDPFRALSEIVRVVKPGGDVKLMVYHRHSVTAFMTWLRRCALRGRVWHSLSRAVGDHVESPGTRAYTVREMRSALARLPLADVTVRTVLTWCDLATMSRSRVLRGVSRALAMLGGGDRVGWFMLVNARKLT